MQDYFLSHEGEIYTGCYFFAIAIVAALEAVMPRRALCQSMGLRWFGNIAVAIIDILLIRSIFPLLGIALALNSSENNWGLMPLMHVPATLAFAIGIIILDFNNYLQHYLLHRIPLLWRLHRMHHSDMDYDFSTSLRFHPLEAIFSVALELMVIFIFGIPAFAYLIYKLVRVLMAAFVHGNLLIPENIDRQLRKVIVTPDLHRIHHSVSKVESNCNFAGVTPWWDKLFNTYIDCPELGQENMKVGLEQFRETKHRYLPWMLLQPFMNPKPTDDLMPSSSAKRLG
ncbi:MAG: sterol desaturase family protein [Pseudomonadales bacterium]|nr:sterol desaturase family protein [Pseudomonadales bacterium]MCP5214825.1 sterol desaturase family protein [Pseudomonadales bacterium]